MIFKRSKKIILEMLIPHMFKGSSPKLAEERREMRLYNEFNGVDQ